MSAKVYVYGLCNIFYDAYYIQGIQEIYKDYQFNISKFPALKQGTFAFIIEKDNISRKIIIDSRDTSEIDTKALAWCDRYGKVNYNLDNLKIKDQEKIVAIGPSFGIKIWNLFSTFYYMILNSIRFRKSVSNKREFLANYWRQYNRFRLSKYTPTSSSHNEVFFINSIWKQEPETNNNRALFIEVCKNDPDVSFEGGFAARKDGNNLGFDDLVYSKRISLEKYLKKIKNAAFVFNTPAVLSCHGWKLAEFLALGKAIISTFNYNKLPADLINGKHLIYAGNQNEIKSAVEKLIADAEYKQNLELESRKYFDQYLVPERVIAVLIEKE